MPNDHLREYLAGVARHYRDLPPDTLLRGKEVAEAFMAFGYSLNESKLENWRKRGGGPAYEKRGRVVYYRWGDVWLWLEANLPPSI